MSPSAWLVIYCVLILLASLAGGWIPIWIKLTHKRMELAVSFVAGVMLGVGLLHMLPHAVLARAEDSHDHSEHAEHALHFDHTAIHELMGPILLWLLAGFLVMFFIERFFCFHHHDAPASSTESAGSASEHRRCDHDHAHAHNHAPSKHRLTWTGAAVGLSIHSLIEGIALAASVEIGRQHAHEGEVAAIPVGLATFLVIFLHKPFDSLTLGTLMHLGDKSEPTRHLINALFSLLIPMGAILFYLGLHGSGDSSAIVSAALAFSAGTFLCIAMSDLLPELQFHQHDRGKLSIALLSGLAIAWVISVLESQVH